MDYKNGSLICATSYQRAYTTPGSPGGIQRTAVVAAQATNVYGSPATLTVSWVDVSKGDVVTELCYQLPIATGVSINVIAGKLILEAGDYIQAKTNAEGAIEISVSVAELI